MKVVKAKTSRFAALVEKFGKPEQITLWTKPEEDREFMRAVKELRVVTVLQNNVGTKKDVGMAGFLQRPGAAFLVFPKPLPFAEETKIVGINYDLLASSGPKGEVWKPKPKPKIVKAPLPKLEFPKKAAAKETAVKEARSEPEPKKPMVQEFEAEAEVVARQTFVLRAAASNLQEARKLLEGQLAALTLSKPEQIKRKLGKVKRG